MLVSEVVMACGKGNTVEVPSDDVVRGTVNL